MIKLLASFAMIFTIPHLQASEAKVSKQLDALHAAASKADAEEYFSLFSADAHFIGTDITEFWTLKQFKDYALPHFKKGRGWTYLPKSRQISFSQDGRVAWFHEILESEAYGMTRGTGVLQLEQDQWKITQYHLTIPVPNQLAKKLVNDIQALGKEKSQ